jgi:hypothetical protein
MGLAFFLFIPVFREESGSTAAAIGNLEVIEHFSGRFCQGRVKLI